MEPIKTRCPYFREPCLEDDCSAYSRKEERKEYSYGNPLPMIVQSPYCNALKIFLPFVKEEE